MTAVEINQVLDLLVSLFIYAGLGAIGVISRDLIFPEDNNIRENFGLCIFTGIFVSTVSYFLIDIFADKLLYMIIALVSGFFIPALKSWLKGTKLISIIFKGYKNAKSIQSSIEKELEKALDE
jgi:Na+-driven multidrug efflux pump